MEAEVFFIRLRDCFNAGYTMPQFCVDNDIKKPLFIASDANRESFLWELHAQFKYDLRIHASFALLNGKIPAFSFSSNGILAVENTLELKNISEISLEDFDTVIMLAPIKIHSKFRIICLDELTNYFISRTYAEIPLLHFLQCHPGVKLILTNFPHPGDYKGGIEFNNSLEDIKDIREKLKSDTSGNVKTAFDKFGYTNAEVKEMTDSWTSTTNFDNSVSLNDNDYPLVNIKNGKRATAYQPENYKNKIYIFGASHHLGAGAPFNKTIASYLQKMLTENNLPYRVENESQYVYGKFQHIFYNLNKIQFVSGDIIFMWLANLRVNKIPFFDISRAFDSPHNYKEIFAFKDHANEIGFEIVAKHFFHLLIQNNFFQNVDFKYPAPPPPPHRYGIPEENFYSTSILTDNKDLQEYKQKLREKRLKIGATVMNCNPFTLGHQFLTGYAASKVAKLYIFVVEEDKSEFKFADRLKLVQEGVKIFPNVEVIPSGKFIISQKTFGGYFNKENLQNVAVDSSEDVEIFAREIAPTLGINIRFAGAEPEDTVTRQYNENMKNILPHYGIDFCEIPRKEINGEIISAKAVRAALKVGDFEKISKLVPITTLEFLRNSYAHSTPPRCRSVKIKFIGGIFIWLILQSVTSVLIAARR